MEFQRGIERLETKKPVITICERSISFRYLITLFDNRKSNTANNVNITIKDKLNLSKIDQKVITNDKVNNCVKTIKEKLNLSKIDQKVITNDKVNNCVKTTKNKLNLSKIDQKVITNDKVNNCVKTTKNKLNLSKIDQKVITNDKVNNGDIIRKDKITVTKIDLFSRDQQLMKVNKVEDNLINTAIICESNVNPYMPRTHLVSMKERFNRLSKELEALSPLDGSLVPVLNTVVKKIKKKKSERMFNYKQMMNFWNNL